MTGTRIALWIACVPLLFALGACSTSKGTRSGSGADGTATRGGGYYLDDGPGHLSPADVAAIPDAVPRAEPVLVRTSRPYTVFGRTYMPMSTLAPYRERGVASWYGRRYHGKPTSSGEPYDMYAMTAAHPTLPIPSYVRVTRAGTDRSVVVRVNDRGPFLQNRLIDLSYTAAAKLGFVEMGSAEVEVEAITRFDAPGTPMLVEAPGRAATSADGAGTDGAAAGGATTAGAATTAGLATGGATTVRAATAAGDSVPSVQDRPVALAVASSEDALSDSAAREGVPGRLVVETRFSDPRKDPDRTARSMASPPAELPAERVSAERTSLPLSPTRHAGGQAGAQAGAQAGGQAGGQAVAQAGAPAGAQAGEQGTALSGAPGFWLQLGAFASADGARTALERFRRELAWLGTRFDLRHEGGLYKVQAGPWAQRDHALDAAARVRGATGLQSFPIFR